MDILTQKGRVVVVTGATGGIGLAIAKSLAAQGAKVYITSRSLARAEKTRNTLVESLDINPGDVQGLQLDFSDLKSVDAAAAKLMGKERRLDLLINNAGVAEFHTTRFGRGWEFHMTINYIGPCLFTNRLLPLIKKTAGEPGSDVRVINLSSVVQNVFLPAGFEFHFDRPDCLAVPVVSHPWQWSYLGRYLFNSDMIRYSVSKVALFLFAQDLQRRLDEQSVPVLVLSVHPGSVATEGFYETNTWLLRLIGRLTFLTNDQGAKSPLWAATARDVREDADSFRGKLLMPGGTVGDPNPVAKDQGQIDGLWVVTNDEINSQLLADGLPPLHAW